MTDHERQNFTVRLSPYTYKLAAKQKALTGQTITSIIHRAMLAYLNCPIEDSFENRVTRLEAKLAQTEIHLTRTRNRVEMLNEAVTPRKQR